MDTKTVSTTHNEAILQKNGFLLDRTNILVKNKKCFGLERFHWPEIAGYK